MSEKWDMATVFERVQDAAATARLLPPAYRQSRCTYWPDFVRNYWDAYQDDAVLPRQRPTARQVEEFDEVTAWLTWLQRADPDMPRVVWVRAAARRASWRWIGKKMGFSHTKAAYTFRVGVALLMTGLNDGRLKWSGRVPKGGGGRAM